MDWKGRELAQGREPSPGRTEVARKSQEPPPAQRCRQAMPAPETFCSQQPFLENLRTEARAASLTALDHRHVSWPHTQGNPACRNPYSDVWHCFLKKTQLTKPLTQQPGFQSLQRFFSTETPPGFQWDLGTETSDLRFL